MRVVITTVFCLVLVLPLRAQEAPAAHSVVFEGAVITETDQAAPNGYSFHVLNEKGDRLGSADTRREDGGFSITVSGLTVKQHVGFAVWDPMGRTVPWDKSTTHSLEVTEEVLRSGKLDLGERLKVVLGPQEPVEAFALGGRVKLAGDEPLPEGFTMTVTLQDGKRKVTELIEKGVFALLFLDITGQHPRIRDGDVATFEVAGPDGKVHGVKPDRYVLTRTDIANSSIATLRFEVSKTPK